MLLAPKKGFVFLAATKTGSTSVETAFEEHVDAAFLTNPFKHTSYRLFQRHLQPYLESKSYDRESYEVVCVAREPIEWLSSWYRYRTREKLTRSRKKAKNYAGETSFDDFAHLYLAHHEGEPEKGAKFAAIGRYSKFMRPKQGERELDRIFRYERLDLLVDFMCEKVGKKVEIGNLNVSPERAIELSDDTRKKLEVFFQPEYEIYNRAIGS